jgi:cytochrome c2
MCRMMDVTSQPVDPASLPEPKSLGAQLLQNQCTQCHGLVAPGQHAVQDWPTIVDRMDRRMQMMSRGRMGMMRQSIQPLTSAERQALLDYLQRHAFQAANLDTLSHSQSPAGQAFINACSRCHALPDPAAHTPREWAGVVDRMEMNMANMGMGPMDAKQKTEILTYLKEQPPN